MHKSYNTRTLYSIIVPVYNAEKSLNELYTRIKNVFEDTIREDFEVILINDFSHDNSWTIMQELRLNDKRVKIIDLARNCGQHAATMCGLNNFNGDFVIIMDDDLQHFPEEIPKLINEIKNHDKADVVVGTFREKKHSLLRNFGSKTMLWVGKKIFKTKSNISLTSFRIIRASTAHKIASIHVDRPRIGQLIAYTTHRISAVEVKHDERKYGKSGYVFTRLFKDFFLNIIMNSSLPLRLISYAGFGISLMSFIIALFYAGRYIFWGKTVVGWTSLMVTITFFSGFILLSLGIIGEYLIRILKENYKLPNYTEREKWL